MGCYKSDMRSAKYGLNYKSRDAKSKNKDLKKLQKATQKPRLPTSLILKSI